MSQSTPISQLPPPMMNDEDPQKIPYIQQIMDEIHAEDQRANGGNDIEAQYPPQYHPSQQSPPPQQYQSSQQPQQQQPQQQQPPQIYSKQQPESSQQQSFTDFLWSELRDPLLFMAFFVLLSLPPVVFVLSKYIPWMINYNTGAATYIGLFVRGFIGGLLYWLIRHYIL